MPPENTITIYNPNTGLEETLSKTQVRPNNNPEMIDQTLSDQLRVMNIEASLQRRHLSQKELRTLLLEVKTTEIKKELEEWAQRRFDAEKKFIDLYFQKNPVKNSQDINKRVINYTVIEGKIPWASSDFLDIIDEIIGPNREIAEQLEIINSLPDKKWLLTITIEKEDKEDGEYRVTDLSLTPSPQKSSRKIKKSH